MKHSRPQETEDAPQASTRRASRSHRSSGGQDRGCGQGRHAWSRTRCENRSCGRCRHAWATSAANLALCRREACRRLRAAGESSCACVPGACEQVAVWAEVQPARRAEFRGRPRSRDLVAVFISNLPEAIASTSGLVAGGWQKARIKARIVLAFAAGAIITMLADTMMPEAFEHGGKLVGVVTTLGFAVAFAIHTLE